VWITQEVNVPATATVKGGFWPTNGVSPLVSIDGRNAGRKMTAMQLADRGQLGLRELIETLSGVVPGSSAVKILTRVESNVELGGKRLIENNTFVNRVTTAADVTRILNDLLSYSNKTTFGTSPPINKDLNPLGTR
jgi:hypothetical protein